MADLVVLRGGPMAGQGFTLEDLQARRATATRMRDREGVHHQPAAAVVLSYAATDDTRTVQLAPGQPAVVMQVWQWQP